jgi:hypothetical protein
MCAPPLPPSRASVPRVATLLGWLGLLPFLGLPALLWLRWPSSGLWAELLAAYALAIICFLAGAWWGISLLRRHTATLWLSNALVVIAWAGYGGLPRGGFFLLAAGLLLAQWWAERRHPLFRPQPAYYAALRARLTVIAVAGLLVASLPAWQ